MRWALRFWQPLHTGVAASARHVLFSIVEANFGLAYRTNGSCWRAEKDRSVDDVTLARERCCGGVGWRGLNGHVRQDEVGI